MRFTAEAASTEVDLNKSQFDPRALYQMAEQIQGKEIPITINFNKVHRVGFVTKAYVKNNRLIVEGEIQQGLKGFVVPGAVIRDAHEENLGEPIGMIRVDTDVELQEFGLTQTPSDPTLKPLREMEVKRCVSTS